MSIGVGPEAPVEVAPGLGWPRYDHVHPGVGWPDVPRGTLDWPSDPAVVGPVPDVEADPDPQSDEPNVVEPRPVPDSDPQPGADEGEGNVSSVLTSSSAATGPTTGWCRPS